MGVESQIISIMQDGGVKRAAILLNGRYLMYSGKRIYTELITKDDRSWLKWFVRQYDTGGKDSNNNNYIPSRIVDISKELESNSLFGVSVASKQELTFASIELDAEYGVIIIKSQLYQIGQQLQNAVGKVVVDSGNVKLSHEEAVMIKQVFFENSLINYRDVVYPQGGNRFAKHLLARDKYYSIRPVSFVPVFINVDWLFNPFTRDDLRIQDTKMWKMAVEKGRFIQRGEISMYLLTHREICEAFGMEHFARFMSSLWYDLFIGVLQPNNPNFPNKLTKIYQWIAEQNPPTGFKKYYTESEFEKVMIEKGSELSAEEFNYYDKVDSIVSYISRNVGKIKSIGPTYLDVKENITTVALQEIYKEAKLLY